MSDDQHRGAHAPGFGGQPGDRRIVDIAGRLAEQDPVGRASFDLARDGRRAVQAQRARFSEAGPLRVGMVAHVLPDLNWYRVQLGDGGTSTPACLLGETSCLPLGVRATVPIPPRSFVLVYVAPHLPYAIILGVLPEQVASGRVVVPDWVTQAGGSGARREAAHRQPITALYRAGGVVDFNCGRPRDATAFEWGRMAETGVGVHIDAFQAYLRVHELCGVFLNAFDGHTRLAGLQLAVQSAIHDEQSGDDEGEARLVRGEALYPYEALGLYAPGTPLAAAFDPQKVQYDLAKAALDLPDGAEDTQPIYRYREYGGYLGQGRQRVVGVPPAPPRDGRRRYRDTTADEGVFREHIAPDGGYVLVSAKSLHIGKRVLITVPKEIRLPEDQTGHGDDARQGNYRFSGQFSTGPDAPPHKIGDVVVPTGPGPRSMLRAAGVLDLVAHAHNWKGLHPFHYHAGDYHTPQESASPHFDRAQDHLDFDTLAGADFMTDPAAHPVAVDPRYGPVNYYQRASGLSFLEDGGIVLDDGYGARIVLAGGQVRIEAPGDIMLLPGKRLLGMAWDIVLRAKNSVDVSAATHDVRLKAERNMELLAGNAGTGGILLESRATKPARVYRGRYGEDVESSGIVLKAPGAAVAALASEIDLRTGVPDAPGGPITLDAGKGTGPVVITGAALDVFTGQGVNLWTAPAGTTAAVTQGHHLGPQGVLLDGTIVLGGTVLVTDATGAGGLYVLGEIAATGGIACAGSLGQGPGGGLVGSVGPAFAPQLRASLQTGDDAVGRQHDDGTKAYDEVLVGYYYTPATALGNADLLRRIGFSYRDPPSGDQYRTKSLAFPEPRWAQLARLGAGTGGVAWVEPPVTAQGVATYPWPGKRGWLTDDAYLRLDRWTMFDPAAGRDRDRPGPYESPTLGTWGAKTTMADGFRTIL